MEEHKNSTETIIMASLSSLPPPQLSNLNHSISTLFHHHHRRLSSLLSSPTLFSLTLHHLHSLSLHHKSLLIARHLLSTLSLLTHFLNPTTTPPPPTTTNLRHLDSVLLLLLLCELRHQNPQALQSPPSKWRLILSKYVSDTMLMMSMNGTTLIHFVEVVVNCQRFIGVMGCGGKAGREMAASVAAVVALPSVEVRGGGRECVICKEEMSEGRDVCELPCHHLFHWMCILPWLKKRNTCPCCRHRLPTDDVSGEIERLWDVVVKVGRSELHGDCT
ncbi:hypothetical protein CsSME_00017144 [Camellia sinensis var. sinensis]